MTVWTPDTCRALMAVAGTTLRPGGLDLTEYLLGFGKFTPGNRVLDAGCGSGATLHYLMATHHLAAVGVDSSITMLTAARQQAGDAALVCAALENMPFFDASFDGIICECVLAQTVASKVLAGFHRVLRTNGLLLISDIYRRQSGSESCPVPDDQLLTKSQAESMLKATGFTVEHWEDRTSHLKQLAFQLIMAAGKAEENLCDWLGDGMLRTTAADSGFTTIGYHLLVARRDGA